MHEKDPLDNWLIYTDESFKQLPGHRSPGETRKILQDLEQLLVTAPPGKVDYGILQFALLDRSTSARLQSQDFSLAQQLYVQIWERGGAGSNYLLDQLTELLALVQEPTLVPFWQSLLNLSKPRDLAANSRRTAALAALALLAIRQERAEAYAALAEALNHTNEHVRALAAYYLADAYLVPRRRLPDDIRNKLSTCATGDRAFAPRYQARKTLQILGYPLPLDNPEGTYHFKVYLKGNRKVTRTLALCSKQTLSDLHLAIQRAFKWDADHLYTFYMSGKRGDERYEIGCPEIDDDWGFDDWLMVTDEEAEGELLDDEGDLDNEGDPGAGHKGLYTTTARIGMLGLVPKHKFIYFFDFGDCHEFEVTVLAIQPQTEPGKYPRLIEAVGPAPRQYYSYEDEELEDEEG